jgi:hypothetical protein
MTMNATTASFRKLRDMIDDDPSGLEALAADDEPVKKLCLAVANRINRQADSGLRCMHPQIRACAIPHWPRPEEWIERPPGMKRTGGNHEP